MAVTSTPALIDAVSTIQTNVTDNILGLLPEVALTIAVAFGLSMGLGFLLALIEAHYWPKKF